MFLFEIISSYICIFNQIPLQEKPFYLKCEINDVLLVTKHIVYRVRFRENVDRFPTIRMMVLTLIIELQKLVPAKRRVNKRTCGLVDIIKPLRIEMNWD